MWKLPFHVLEAEAYSDQVFDNLDECMEKYKLALLAAQFQVQRKQMKVEKFLIFRHQVVALPAPYYDQRIIGVGDVPGSTFDEDRPKSISFE